MFPFMKTARQYANETYSEREKLLQNAKKKNQKATVALTTTKRNDHSTAAVTLTRMIEIENRKQQK